jgi:1-phosphofructokinase
MIVTVTLNPTLDKALAVPRLVPGEIHRAAFIRQDVGGKGINVSRALAALGLDSLPIGFLGGSIGHAMRAGLDALGFRHTFLEVGGETRQNLTLLDKASGQYTKINEPGAAVTEEDLARLSDLIAGLARPRDTWAFCGSLPPGASPDAYAALVGQAQAAGARVLLDTSGPPLAHGIAARPYGIKPNAEEAAEALGRPVAGDEGCLAAARDLAALGMAVVCLTRGADGLVLAWQGDTVIARPPRVRAASPVGAGDATLAGIVWALSDDCDAEEAARRAIACGTAAAMQEGTGVGDRALIDSLRPQVLVTRF